MIIYATKETLKRYGLKVVGEYNSDMAPLVEIVVKNDRGTRLFEWGCKLFYFCGRKCMQLMHFETKLVIFLADLKVSELKYIGDALAVCLMDLYAGDPEMQKALEKYFHASPILCFDRITDKSIIASMNGIQSRWAWDGDRFYGYISDGILHTKKINRDVNEMPVTKKVEGREEWIVPYELFEETIKKIARDIDSSETSKSASEKLASSISLGGRS